MNYSDSERISTYIEALGYEPSEKFDGSDLVIFNTCSIKQKAEDKALGYMKQMKELKRTHRNLTVVITGCMVRTSSSRYSSKRDPLLSRVEELDIALRIEELPKFADLMREINPEYAITSVKEENLEDYFKIEANHSSKAQAFVPVSSGCDKFCTYCIVPYSRGREKSRSIEDIYNESAELVSKGCKEITLLGQTVNSYGLGIYDKINKSFATVEAGKEPFVALLEKIDSLKSQGLERLRFTSPHPKDMTSQLIDAMASLPTMMPYLHLPVQSGDNRTLKRMNRTYTIERYLEIIEELRKKIPGISISTDIIVGFCGETDDEFTNTYNMFKEVCFDHAYISQYSERIGTFASKHITDDVPREVKAERWHKLNDLLKDTSNQQLSRFVDTEVPVLVESQRENECLGRTPHFKTVKFKSNKSLVGRTALVKINKAKDWMLFGEMA